MSGVLPPLLGVRKRIDGLARAHDASARCALPFDVVGRELRYSGAVHRASSTCSSPTASGGRRLAVIGASLAVQGVRASRQLVSLTSASRPDVGRLPVDAQVTGAPREAALPSNRYGLPTSGLL